MPPEPYQSRRPVDIGPGMVGAPEPMKYRHQPPSNRRDRLVVAAVVALVIGLVVGGVLVLAVAS